ncbi:hypothetical protein BC833DRAFT_654016 [Globomyces pollinis-pini]|nr:hypothetical protein BC833DRAFT_654016 [Globomyces pollinis-pini]
MLVYVLFLFNIVASKCKFSCMSHEICLGSFCYQRAYPVCSFSSECMEGEQCGMRQCSIAPGAVQRWTESEQNGSFFRANITYTTDDGKEYKVTYSPGGKTGLPPVVKPASVGVTNIPTASPTSTQDKPPSNDKSSSKEIVPSWGLILLAFFL